LLSACLTVMAGATISPSLPALYDHYADVSGVEVLSRLVLTLPALFIALCSPLAGLAVDRLGRKPVLLAGAVLYVLGGASGLVVDELPVLLVGRAVLGIAVACVMTATVTLIGDYHTGEARSRMMGWMSAFMSWGGVVFVLMGGALAELHWRGPFGVYTAALLLLPLMALALTEPERPRSPTDEHAAPGGTEHAAPAPTRWALIVLVYFAAFMLNLTFYMVPTQAPFLLREMGVMAPIMAGVAIAAMNVAGGIGSLQYGRIRRRLSEPFVFALAFGLIALGFLGVWQADSMTTFMLVMLLAGFGVGSAFPNITTWLMSLAPPHLRGRLVGGTTMSIFLGQFVSPMVSQPMVDAVGKAAAFGLMAGIVAMVAALFLWIGLRFR
jgi:MFS family permease